MLVPLVLLVLITPFLVVRPFGEELVLPKLVATAAFVGVALVWGAVLLVRDRWPSGRLPPAVWVALGAFVAVNIAALAFASDWRGSLLGEFQRYQGLAPTLLYALLFVVAASSVRTTRDVTWLLVALALAAFGTSVYALIQKAGWDWADLTGRDPDRPGSTVGQANNFGAFLVMAGSACVFLFFVFREHWQRAILAGLLGVVLFALLFTVSQSAYLAAGVVFLLWGGVALFWLVPRFAEPGDRLAVGIGAGTLAIAPLVIAALVITFVGLPGRESVRGAFDSESIEGRLSLWRMGIDMGTDRPLFGHGQDAFSIKFPEYRDRPDLPGIGTRSIDPESAHNFYIDLLSGTGFLGLGAFLLLAGVVFWNGARYALTGADAERRFAVVALSTAVLSNLAALFFGFAEAMTTWLLWLLLGALAGLLATERRRQAEDGGDGLELGGLGAGVGAVVLVVLGALAIGWSATLTAAEVSSGSAAEAAGEGRNADAARLADRAESLNPLMREYLLQEADAHERAADAGPTREQHLRAAIETYETAGDRFTPTAFGVLSQALAQIELLQETGNDPVETAFPLLEQALELDPYNEEMRMFVADKYAEFGFQDRAVHHRFVLLSWRGEQAD